MVDNTQETPTQKNPQQEFSILRIYTKDLSFESPNAPEIFNTEWSPHVDLNIQTENKKLADDTYEVILQVTVTVKLQDKTAFLVEVKEAGVFVLKNFPDNQIDPMLGSFCPNIIFPYARELVSETISRGNFPPLYLAPINFDAFYQEQLKKKGN